MSAADGGSFKPQKIGQIDWSGHGLASDLKVENERLRAENDNIKQVEFPRRLEKAIEGWRKKCDRIEAENTRLREAVTVARDTFALYAERHREKRTGDGNIKAAINADLALRMDAALTPNLELTGRAGAAGEGPR